MRPAGAILPPGEEILATGICFYPLCLMRLFEIHWPSRIMPWLFLCLVQLLLVFKFVEPPQNNEKPMEQKSGVKFKIMSLKIKIPTDYMPELVSKNGSYCSESVRVKYVMWVGGLCVSIFAVWGAKRSCLWGASNACGILGSWKP